MNINVKSEYGKLKKVLLHRPGKETSNLTPSTFEDLLFDDAYFLPQAQKEHDAFADTFRKAGVEVFYLEDLVAETIEKSSEAKEEFIEKFIMEAGVLLKTNLYKRTRQYIESFSDMKKLVVKLMEGVRYSELAEGDENELSLVELVEDKVWVLEPLPNLVFTRDPFSTFGNGISLHKMANNTRRRETLFSDIIFKYHPEFKDTPKYYERELAKSIEGGDVMVLSDTKLAVGISMRTEPEAIETLAQNVFADQNSTIDTIYGVNIPKGRSWMHLDTVFTQIDKNIFTVFSDKYEFDFYKIEKTNDGHKTIKMKYKLDEWLKEALGLNEVKLIVTGDGDPIYSEIEQWNDGSNVLAIGPKEVIVYDRNLVSNAALERAGVKIHKIPSYELSRGRGGPRCMSMPLEREEV